MGQAAPAHELTVEWGDCDEAGVVFYPNYFYWFDCGFQRLLRAHGLSQRRLRERFGAVTPLVEAAATFRAPARYDDVLTVAASVDRWEERRFRVAYRLSHGETVVVEGHEVRAWARLDAAGRLRGAPVEAAFRKLLGGEGD